MAIWVLGSGPIPRFPDENPRIVILAHGAVQHLTSCSGEIGEKWLLLAANVLGDPDPRNPEVHDALLRIVLDHAPYEASFIRDSLDFGADDGCRVLHALEISDTCVPVTFEDLRKLVWDIVGTSGVLSLLMRAHKVGTLGFLRGLASSRFLMSSKFLKVSTGVLGVLLASSVLRPSEPIRVFGVTLDSERYAHVYPQHPERHRHRGADVAVLRSLIARRPSNRVEIEDSSLRTAVGAVEISV